MACDRCAKLCSLGDAAGLSQFSSAPAKALRSKGFRHTRLLPLTREALAAKVQFDYVRKEAATVHAFDLLLFMFSTRPVPYALGLRRVTSWRAGWSENGALAVFVPPIASLERWLQKWSHFFVLLKFCACAVHEAEWYLKAN